ncbi:chemotaxis protein CheB [Chitinophaga arvensicola]|uniref:histidine kinase n=1 Tax=Chitinophaga arvensicola TaxID=29529 RepID=A0A1I0RNU2_9BACT|nr:chemotaxis protein CheB [Chitinophaga arvensicola]SEW42896.1 two-component system, chemotaxis family, CheB/CheR fusion protein [Chitinophaga arvensicola]
MRTQYNQDPHFIVAIGASAGGIEELQSFFDHTPLAQASYIIIQHLSADYKSRMVEILSRHSQLQVKEAANNMLVEPNQVYLIPSPQSMTIQDGRLFLKDKSSSAAPHRTINTFFNSLAADNEHHLIAVILSGSGDDGSEGIVTICKAGGMIMVQNPATAQYNGMPLSAIATGVVDHVLTPAEMPAVITEYVNKSKKSVVTPAIQAMEEKSITAIIDLIREKLPFDFSEYKPTTILRRIRRRMVYFNFEFLEPYYQYLLQHPGEVETLAQSFMISVSSFFRNPEAFDVIRETVLPEIMTRKKPEEEIKIWIAGCATGEEAYTMAILLYEEAEKTGKEITIKVFATDIDKSALEFAGKGLYGDQVQQEISPARLARHFIQEANGYRIKQHIRKMLIFAQHNVVKNPPYCNMDLISCRNLLIYMNISLQQKALAMLHFGLSQQGYLFLGSSENMGMLQPHLTEIDKKWKIYRNQASARSVRFDIFTPVTLADSSMAPLVPSKKTGNTGKKSMMLEEVNELLFAESDFAGVCVDTDHRVVKYFGKVERFLQQQVFSFNLMDLLPGSLSVVYATAAREALKNNERVTVTGIAVAEYAPPKVINLTIRPLHTREADRALLLVLFTENKTVETPAAPAFDLQVYLNAGLQSLEEELKDTRQRLQEAMEKLDASNENMQSFNEELVSANEEMQSANEEMQSVNEELQTINTDYQLKIRELIVLNDDMDNYFRSNLNGQLFVDNKLLLKKFSPAAIRHINLQESDIGRPIHDITVNFKDNSLEQDLRQVIDKGVVLSRVVESFNGNWYQMMVMPYIRQLDHLQDGAIISFNDISLLKKAELELNRSNLSLQRINEDLDNFVNSASHDLLGPLTSIEGLMQLLNEKVDMEDKDIVLYTDMIGTSIKRFKENLRELAEVGKIESEAVKEVQEVEIGSVLDEVFFSIQDKMQAATAVISRNLAENKLIFSRKNLRSILYNLITNAVKFRAADRPLKIEISTRKENGFLLMEVKDNGIGIEQDKLGAVFSMYKRLHPEIEGLGIGLFLVRKIVDASGGMTAVDSVLNQGSTFKIYFKTN